MAASFLLLPFIPQTTESMVRTLLLFALSLATCGAFAQEKRSGKSKVVKGEAKELPAAETAPPAPPPAPEPTALAVGDFDTPPAPPACAEFAGQERLDCVSEKVLAEVRSKVGKAGLDMKSWGHTPVSITFLVNQFGDMKDIRVEHFGDNELPKKVIVALYGLPKFTPANKGGANVSATIQLTYSYAQLFPAE